ncbi:MAG: hypothetical protein ACI92S_003922 [Planctomycetaceae bacterium]|jgi:hypothetical protein
MKAIDFAKATGIGVALLALNLLIATLVIIAYAVFIEPGHPDEFYHDAAMRIAPWCSHIIGTALFLGAVYLFTRRNPARNGFVFATVVALLYAIIDAAMVGFACLADLEFGLSMLAKLAAILAGSYLAIRRTRPATASSEP